MSSGRIGYYWSCKKSLKLDASVFRNACSSYGFELVKIDCERPLEEQGPFVAIVHKLYDYLQRAEDGDKAAADILESFQMFVKNHPEVVLIDPLEDIRKVTNRFTQYMSIKDEFSEQDGVFVPAFVELTSRDVKENMSKLKSAGIEFPILCKPDVAHGSPSHKMCIVFCEAGLKDISPPCVAQKMINHNAVLYKLFTIGNKYVMIQRPSLKNFNAEEKETIYFNSHDVSKSHSASALSEMDDDEPKTPLLYPDKDKTDHIVEVLTKSLGLHLLGIDIIIDNETGRYAVIDINYFPGYYEIENFFTLLVELIASKVSLKLGEKINNSSQCDRIVPLHATTLDKESQPETGPKPVAPSMRRCLCCTLSSVCLNSVPTEPKKSKTMPQMSKSHFHSADCLTEDSGIETSDSCDERKEPCRGTLKQLHSKSVFSSLGHE